MASDEQFALRWSNFHSSMSTGFHGLLECGDLVDVTLAAEGRLLQAHKLVLSVCSPYFREMFKNNPTQHPIVFLKDVSHNALQNLLQFMYQGEVNVEKEDLSAFIDTAQQLQVKCIIGDTNEDKSTSTPTKPTRSSLRTQVVKSKKMTDLVCKPSTSVAVKQSDSLIISQSRGAKRKCVDPLESPTSGTVNKTFEFIPITNDEEISTAKLKVEPIENVSDDENDTNNYEVTCEDYDSSTGLGDAAASDQDLASTSHDKLTGSAKLGAQDTAHDSPADYILSSRNEDDQRQGIFFKKDSLGPNSEEEFKTKYRISKDVFQTLLKLLKHNDPVIHNNCLITTDMQILMTLDFYGSGSIPLVIEGVRVDESLSWGIIENVSIKIAKLRPEFVQMPKTAEDRARISRGFYEMCGLPHVVGTVDCTHVTIQAPGGPTETWFKNQKGHFSLKVQAVCDSNLKILDVVARWPAQATKAAIFDQCQLKKKFDKGLFENNVLIAGSDYPSKNYLVTPTVQPATAAVLSTPRNPVKRCFAALKNRFPCLVMDLGVTMKTEMAIIVACTVLHNIAISKNDLVNDLPELEPEGPQ